METKTKSGLFSLFEMIMDMAGLNVLFVLFCLPVVTGGAAMTALMTALRAMIKREPCFRAFFHGFKVSFWRATAVWILLLIPVVPSLINAAAILRAPAEGYLTGLLVSVGMSLVWLGILCMVLLFYSRFEGTLLQLLRYGGTLAITYPLRALFLPAMLLIPAGIAVWALDVFNLLGMVWLFFYFSAVCVADIWLMNRPFAKFAKETLGIDPPTKKQEKDGEEN